MSNIQVDAVSDSAGNNDMTIAGINQGRAKAWCNFNGTGTIATRDAYNVSSITDAGVGTYIVNTTVSGSAYNAATVASGIQIGVGGAFVSSAQQYTNGITHLSYLSSAPSTPADVSLISAAMMGNQL